MKRYILFFILSTLFIYGVTAQSNKKLFRLITKDSQWTNRIREELDSTNKTAILKNLTVLNCQMDSILKNITTEKKGRYISSYYLTIAKHNEKLYVEIINIDSHNYIIEFSNQGISSDNYLRKGIDILGCVIYNDSYFYILSFPKPNSVEEKEIRQIFASTNKEIIIRTEKIDDNILFLESLMRLYEYKNGNFKSLNDFPPSGNNKSMQ
ncbi:MAG TPA: hypothetical protein DEF88_03250 [Porphyromonadaceae bacterium]|jgi:hypothetical protein|nr:hypothetical protein [Porphyromonadaceae bacterium]